jgi:hypothetical protein
MRTQKIADRQRLTQQVRDLVAAEVPLKDVAERLRIPYWQAAKFARLDVVPRVITAEIAAEFSRQVWALRDQGWPDTKIAIELDVSIPTICYWAGPSGTTDRQAQRRARAFQLCAQGASHSEIVRAMAAAESTVTNWMRQYRKMVAAEQCDRKSS